MWQGQGAVLNRIEEGIIISPTNTSATFDLQDNIAKFCDDEVNIIYLTEHIYSLIFVFSSNFVV